MFYIYPSQQLLLYETRFLPYDVISQNKALFRVFSFGLANSASKQLCGGLVVVGRPLLLGQRARLLLLVLADAGLDHGGVDAWEVDPQAGLVVGGRRLLQLVVAGRPGGHRRGRYGAHVLRLHLGALHGLDLLGVGGEPDALPRGVLWDDEAEPDDEYDAEGEGDGGEPAGQPRTQVQAAHPLGPGGVIAAADLLSPEDPHDVLADAAPQPLLRKARTLEVVPMHGGRGQAAGVALDGLRFPDAFRDEVPDLIVDAARLLAAAARRVSGGKEVLLERRLLLLDQTLLFLSGAVVDLVVDDVNLARVEVSLKGIVAGDHVAVDPISRVLLLRLGDEAVGAEVVGLLAAVARARPEHRHPPVPGVHLIERRWTLHLRLVDGVPHHALHPLMHLVEHAPDPAENIARRGPEAEP